MKELIIFSDTFGTSGPAVVVVIVIAVSGAAVTVAVLLVDDVVDCDGAGFVSTLKVGDGGGTVCVTVGVTGDGGGVAVCATMTGGGVVDDDEDDDDDDCAGFGETGTAARFVSLVGTARRGT